jgi:transmembrane sensor
MITADSARRSSIADEAVEWFVAHRAGVLGDGQRRAFVAWLRSSPDHMGEYLALTELAEDLTDVLKVWPTANADLLERAALADTGTTVTVFNPRMSRPNRSSSPQAHIERMAASSRRRILFGAGAATIALLLAVGLAGWWHYDRTNFATGHAEQRSWRLSDGSVVHLNSATRMKIDFDGKERRVYLLSGQAIFQVAKDAAHPFVVRTGGAVVRAVGTQFDVYRQSGGATVVSVIEGRVALVDARIADDDVLNSRPLFLDAGQQAGIDSGKALVSTRVSDVNKAVAWLQRKVAFDHDPLAVAAGELNRYNDLQIFVADGAAAASQISGTFSAYDADSFVRFLERQSEMRVVRDGKKIIVSSAVRRQ